MKNTFDVTVSVWNDFWAPELCEGLARNGYRVLAVRSKRRKIPGVRTESVLSSGILTELYHRIQIRGLIETAENIFEAFAKRRTGLSPVFWGWNDHNLTAFRSALAKGQRVICERGSSHGFWGARRLNTVHRDLGWGPTDLEKHPRIRRGVEEYALSEKIMIPSTFVRDTFLEEGFPEEKLCINPYGVDLALWSQVSGTRRLEGPLVFVYTASVQARKGAHILLRAWHQAALKDAELWLCGSVCLPLKRLGLPVDKNVKFLGYRQHAGLAEIYDRASVYVLPSFEEGMARSGIEALAAGMPAIVTKETGLTDLMTKGDEGWIVESGNVEQLAETFRTVARDRHSLPMRSAAARQCTQKSDKRDYGNRAADFLKNFLDEK